MALRRAFASTSASAERVARAFTRAAPEDLAAFARIVGAANVIDGAAPEAEGFRLDWLRQHRGRPACVVRPRDAGETAAVLRHCSARRIAVVPQGGNTGLVGGGVPLSHEVVLSTRRMDAVGPLDADAGVVACGAGAVLQALDAFLEPHGLMVPLDLGSKGSCAVGGNVSTNAGGLRLLRYGSLHGSVLGLEVVTARGEVLDMMSALRKDNVGFDLKQLFIGSEGALGVVTRVALLAAPRPAAVSAALIGAADFGACRALLRLARESLGEVLSAAEFVDARAMALTLETLGLASPLAGGPAAHGHFFFVECSGSSSAHDAAKLEGFLEKAFGRGLAGDGVVAAEPAKARRLFRLREDVSVALSQRGHVFKYDVSLKMDDMYRLVEEMRERLDARGWAAHGVHAVGYGHIGDGNLHLNISTKGRAQDYLARLEADIEPFVYERVIELGGSISAEHGVGQAKADWLARAKPAPVVEMMKLLKRTLDPEGILNPGKVIPFTD